MLPYEYTATSFPRKMNFILCIMKIWWLLNLPKMLAYVRTWEAFIHSRLLIIFVEIQRISVLHVISEVISEVIFIGQTREILPEIVK